MSLNKTMIVTVKLYALLSRYKPELPAGKPFQVDLPQDATIEDLLHTLNIPSDEVKVTFVNNIIQPIQYHLTEGDMVGLFPPIAGGSGDSITLDIWLYGELASYGGESKQAGYANLKLSMPSNTSLKDVLEKLNLPTEERGITFINGNLSAMPGVQPDLDITLKDGDRVALFHLRSMWPFQYRFGIPMTEEMTESMHEREDKGLHHAYE
ncbi:MAG: MoaD/ThiS family protein [Chloroflexota bacterium]